MPINTTAVPASTAVTGSVTARVRQPTSPIAGSRRRVPNVSADALAIA